MADGLSSLDSMIAKCRALGTLPDDIARVAAPLVEAEGKRTASAGTTPMGEPWRARKDGERALENAATAVSASAAGSTVTVKLGSTSTGSAKVQAIQNASRQIIPKHSTRKGGGAEGIPPGYEKALNLAAQQVWDRAMGVN